MKKSVENQNLIFPSEEKVWRKYYRQNIPQSVIAQSLYDNLYDSNKDYLQNKALLYFGKSITYGELFEKIYETEKALWRAGVRKEDVVGVCSINTPEIISAYYAINHIGAVINLMDVRSSVNDLEKFIKEGNSKLVICLDSVYGKIKAAVFNLPDVKIVTVSPANSLSLIKQISYSIKSGFNLKNNALNWNDFIAGCENEIVEHPAFQKDQVAVYAHTGGTTGFPKTVQLSSENLNAVAWNFKYGIVPINRGDRYYNDLPPFIIYGFSVALHSSLCIGLELVVYPKFNSKTFPAQFKKYKPNYFAALSGHIKNLIEDKKISRMNLSFLKAAAVGGDSLNTQLEIKANEFLKKHHCENCVSKGFGMTELAAAVMIAFGQANDTGSVGIPMILNNVKVVDTETHEELQYNKSGEVWISGPSVMLGYLNNQKENESIISTDENGTRWLHTGDIGYINEQGLVYITGRLKRMYLSVAENQPVKIFPVVIENALKEHNDVYDAVAVGRLRTGTPYYETVVFVIKTSECKITEKELRNELFNLSSEKIPPKMQPCEIRFIAEFPITPGGKVDFQALETVATLRYNPGHE